MLVQSAVSNTASAVPRKIRIAIAGLRLIVDTCTVGDQTAVDSTFLASPIVVLHALASVDPNVPNVPNGMLVQSAVSNTASAVPRKIRIAIAGLRLIVDTCTVGDQTAVDSTFLASPIVVLHALASVDPNVPNVPNGMLVQSAVSNTASAVPRKIRIAIAGLRLIVDTCTVGDQTAVDSTFLASPIVVLHALASVDPNVPNVPNGMLVQSAVSNTASAVPRKIRIAIAGLRLIVDTCTVGDQTAVDSTFLASPIVVLHALASVDPNVPNVPNGMLVQSAVSNTASAVPRKIRIAIAGLRLIVDTCTVGDQTAVDSTFLASPIVVLHALASVDPNVPNVPNGMLVQSAVSNTASAVPRKIRIAIAGLRLIVDTCTVGDQTAVDSTFLASPLVVLRALAVSYHLNILAFSITPLVVGTATALIR
jgi:hypothetical protein